MSKFLPTMTIDEFKLCLPQLKFFQLKQLLEGIYEFKRSEYKKHTPESPVVMDMERKETILLKELNRRGVDITSPEFLAWNRAMANRADKFLVVKK